MSQKDRNSPNVPDEDRLQELLAEATVDCYDEEEEFWGIWTMLEEELHFPLSASLIGEPVELIGLDGNASSSIAASQPMFVTKDKHLASV